MPFNLRDCILTGHKYLTEAGALKRKVSLRIEPFNVNLIMSSIQVKVTLVIESLKFNYIVVLYKEIYLNTLMSQDSF